MTDEQKKELVTWVEKGSQFKVRSKDLFCILYENHFSSKRRLCLKKWMFALIGKFGHLQVAQQKYEELYQRLPPSNQEYQRVLYAVGVLLECNWMDLVALHLVCKKEKEEVEDFRRLIQFAAVENDKGWGREIIEMVDKPYEQLVAQHQANS